MALPGRVHHRRGQPEGRLRRRSNPPPEEWTQNGGREQQATIQPPEPGPNRVMACEREETAGSDTPPY